MSQARFILDQDAASPQRVPSYSVWSLDAGYHRHTLQLGVSLVSGATSRTKPNFEDFGTHSYCLIKYLCTSYPDELQLSMGLGECPAPPLQGPGNI